MTLVRTGSFAGRLRTVRGAAIALVAVAPLAVVGACGDDTTGTAPDDLTLEAFPEAFRDAECTRAVSCLLFPDVDACKAALAYDRWLVDSVGAAAYGKITYDPAKAKECIDALTNASCESAYFVPPAVRESCDPVFGGRGAVGAPCLSAAECQGTVAACEGSCGEDCCEGTCVSADAFGQEGDACDDLTPCAPDFYCSFVEGGTTECVKRAGANETCVIDGCIDGYQCDNATLKCFKQATSGAQCNPGLTDACASLGEYCSADTSKCVALPEAGQPCAVNGTSDMICARYAVCLDGTCVARPQAGEACIGSSVCLGDLQCSGDPDNLCLPLNNARACVDL
ncbi:MAG: hypothetical protein U0271_25700 [Polyangiaceae bacterium]